jgi:predicted ArsR family transcriptional regulator
MNVSQEQIIEFIRSHRVARVEEISAALNMTQANIRHHLSILQKQGLVENKGKRFGYGKGRPARLFGLPQYALGENINRLLDILLQEIAIHLPTLTSEIILHRVAERMAHAQAPDAQTHPGGMTHNLTQRLSRTIAILNTMNYQAHWEAHTRAPRLIFNNCPYASIIEAHPELCRIDEYLIQDLIGKLVYQKSKRTIDNRGLHYCMFSVEE